MRLGLIGAGYMGAQHAAAFAAMGLQVHLCGDVKVG